MSSATVDAVLPSTAARFLTIDEVSTLTGISRQTLAHWRSSRLAGPAFVKLGGKFVRYPREQLEEWLASRMVTPNR